MAVSFFRSGEWGVARNLNCAKLRETARLKLRGGVGSGEWLCHSPPSGGSGFRVRVRGGLGLGLGLGVS